ncbi:MAG: DUF4340 domain-containing protein [Planctomycetota bacterium]
MNQIAKTGVAVGAAVALTLIASSMGPREVQLAAFDDQGQEFWPDFKDGNAVAELEVVEFREASAAAYPFVVKRDDKGRWTIPSHGNYAADAKDRMGKAAAMLIGLKKQTVVGDVKGRHADYGVVDPLDAGTETAGRGKRIKMKDSAGNVLADLIIGKELEGKMGVHYVRLPDKKRVYRTKLEGELSTKFADWIETDLLKATSWDISKVTFDNYSVDEQNGTINKGEQHVVTKDDAGKWAFAGIDATKEEPNEDKLREIGDTLGQIKIVGVRPKPEGLTAMLDQATGFDRQILQQTLAQKGFFLTRQGKLVSNEGDLLFETKKGVRYTLRFGEVVMGEGDAVTAGTPNPNEKPKEGEAQKPGNNRYLMVTAEFVEDLLTKPAGTRLPQDQLDKRTAARTEIEAIQKAVEAYRTKHENKLPELLAKLTEKPAEGEPLLKELKKDPWDNDYQLQVQGDTYAIVSFADGKAEGGEGIAADVRSDRLPAEDELKKTADAFAEHDRKVEEGRKEADKLTKRFGLWYYVIDQALFTKLKPKRDDLVKPKAATPPPTPPGNGGTTEPGK